MQAEYCDQSVCVSVCVCVCLRAYLWNCWTDLHQFLCISRMAVARRRCDTLCTSGFVDDVTRLAVMGRTAYLNTGEKFDVYECLLTVMW